jgi:hypothetical protein
MNLHVIYNLAVLLNNYYNKTTLHYLLIIGFTGAFEARHFIASSV